MINEFSDFELTVWAAVVGATVSGVIQIFVYVLNIYSKSIDRREEQRDETARKIEQMTVEIRDLACKYWCTPGNNPNVDRIGYSVSGRHNFNTKHFKSILIRNEILIDF